MVQHHQSLLAAELGVAHVDGGVLFQLTGVAGLAAVDHVHTLGVGGTGEADRPVLIRLAHGDGGHEDVPVGVDGAGLVAFRAAHHDAVRTAFHHVDVHIRVLLFGRRQGPVALGVRHGPVHGQVVVLHVNQELLEVLMVVGAVLLVHLKRAREHRVKGVHAHAALEAAGGFLPQQALHLHLVHQVLRGLVQVGEAVDGVAGQAGLDGHQVLVLGVLGQGVGHGDAVDGGADHGVVHPVVNLLAEHVHTGFQLPEGVDVFLRGFQCHSFSPHTIWFVGYRRNGQRFSRPVRSPCTWTARRAHTGTG